jgi:hypothetical protein
MQVFDQDSTSLPTESDLLAKPSLAHTWAGRVMADDQKVRAKASAELAGRRENPAMLRRFLRDRDERLRQEAFEIIRRMARVPSAVDRVAGME